MADLLEPKPCVCNILKQLSQVTENDFSFTCLTLTVCAKVTSEFAHWQSLLSTVG